MLSLVSRSLKDLFDKKLLLLSFLPVFVSAVFLGIVFFVFSDGIHQFFVWAVGHIPFLGGELVTIITQSIAELVIFYELLLIMSILFVGLIADAVVDRINGKYYYLEKRGFGTFLGSMLKAIRSNILFIMLFLILIPFLFIPFLNIAVHIFLWAILIRSPMLYDSLAFYARKKEFEEIKRSNRLQTWLLSLVAASLFLIPLFGVFLYLLQLIMFTHFSLSKLKEIQDTEPKG